MADAKYAKEWARMGFEDSCKELGVTARLVVRRLSDLIKRTEDEAVRRHIALMGKEAVSLRDSLKAWESPAPKDSCTDFDAFL